MTNKFKVGDKVIATEAFDYQRLSVFTELTVESVDTDPQGNVMEYLCEDRYCNGWYILEDHLKLVETKAGVEEPTKIISDGGPSGFYDFIDSWTTWNDFADYKATHQWKEHSFHLGNIGKALCRWGNKSGTTKAYDSRKIIYSGLRVLVMLEGKASVLDYLNTLIEDEQFKGE